MNDNAQSTGDRTNRRVHNPYFTPEPVFNESKHVDVKRAIAIARENRRKGKTLDAPIHIPPEVAAV